MIQTKIYRIVNDIDDLKTLPSVYINLSNMIENPDVTAAMIGEVIAEDQVIAAKVLKVVNSAFYGFPRRISSLREAIVILGLDEIKNLVLGTSVLDAFLKTGSNQVFDMNKLWAHSIGCAVGSKIIAQAVCPKDAENAFAAGLLHDVGKLIHATFLAEEFGQVISHVSDTGMPISEAEDQIMGFNHAQTGKILAQKWKLPGKLLSVIEDHHLPGYSMSAKPSKEISITHLADILCISLRLGSSGDTRVPVVDMRAWEVLALKLSNLEPIMEKLQKGFKESISILAF